MAKYFRRRICGTAKTSFFENLSNLYSKITHPFIFLNTQSPTRVCKSEHGWGAFWAVVGWDDTVLYSIAEKNGLVKRVCTFLTARLYSHPYYPTCFG